MAAFWNHILSTFSAETFSGWWNPRGYLEATPVGVWHFESAYIVLLVFLLLGALIVPFMKRMDTRLREKFTSFFWTNLVLALIFGGARWQFIPIFGMDIWRLIHELSMVAWLIITIVNYRKAKPKEQLAAAVAAYKAKYLPKPK